MIKKCNELMVPFYIAVTIVFISISTTSLFSQTDSIPKHNTIKVVKQKDSVYVKAQTNFFVYYDNPGSKLSYRDYVMLLQSYSSSRNTERLKINDAKPKTNSDIPFDYASYFQNNHFTKDIKLQKGETEMVKLLVYVTKNGEVKFIDTDSVGNAKDVDYLYSKDRRQFKQDATHVKTQNAFKELITQKWEPAIIRSLKTHPSKRKNKYKISKGYSEGILTIIYSSEPIEKQK